MEDYKPGNLQSYTFKYDLKFKLGPNFIISLRSKKSLIRDLFENLGLEIAKLDVLFLVLE